MGEVLSIYWVQMLIKIKNCEVIIFEKEDKIMKSNK